MNFHVEVIKHNLKELLIGAFELDCHRMLTEVRLFFFLNGGDCNREVLPVRHSNL